MSNREGGTPLFRRLFSRVGLLWIWIALDLVALAALAYWHLQRQQIFETTQDWLWLGTAASAVLLAPIVLLTLDPVDNYGSGPRRRLPLVTLALLAALATVAYLDSALRWNLLRDGGSEPVRVLFLAVFIIAVISRIWNASNFAAFTEARREVRARAAKLEFIQEHMKRYPDSDRAALEAKFNEQNEEDEVTSLGALIVTLVVTAIGALAYVVGNGTDFNLQGTFGFFLCFAFVGLFIVVVFVDLFDQLPAVQGLSRALDSLAVIARPLNKFYGWLDGCLVRIAAPSIGTSHRTAAMRYTVLIGTMGALVIMGLCLPPPYGLVPAFVGFALAVAVSRLWNWVEEDRSLAALTKYKATAPYQTDLSEDYLDETLLAFAFVFLLAPIAMMQASDGQIFGEHLFQNASARHVQDWIGFFGLQLANALPILGWAQIYGIETHTEIDIDSAASRHAVFLARVMIDLVLVAALFQAIGVLTRNRQQKGLYRAGHIDRLDPFIERAEFARAMRLTADADKFELVKLSARDLVDFRIYNEDRLRALFASDRDARKRAFISQIAVQRGISLSPAIDRAIDLAQTNGDQVELINAFTRAEQDHKDKLHPIEANDLFDMLTALRTRTGLRDFKEHIVDVMEKVATPDELIDLLSGLANGPNSDSFQYAKRYMTAAIERARAARG